MSGISITIDIDDREIHAALTRLIGFGLNPSTVMRDLAEVGESTTKDRFRDGRAPDGNAWIPSRRVQDKGGKTLIKSSRLLNSIVSQASADVAQWGSNVVYAAIHQFGGKAGRNRKVTIPARPFFGVNDNDAEILRDIVVMHITRVI